MRTLYTDGAVVTLADTGEIRVNGKVRQQWTNSNGYLSVKIRHANYTVHRLLALAYLPRETHQTDVNHKDGDKTNNSLSNLEWCTRRENLHHAMRAGLHTNPEVPVIAYRDDSFEGHIFASQSVAKAAGFYQANISKCLHGLRHTTGGYQWARA